MLRKKLNDELAKNKARAAEIIAASEARAAAGDQDTGFTAEEKAELATLRTRRGDIEETLGELDAAKNDGVELEQPIRRPMAGQVTGVVDAADKQPKWGDQTGAPFGEFLQAVFRDAALGIHDPRLDRAATPGLGQNETIGPDGGFLVNTDISNEIMQRVRTGEIIKRVRHIPVSANSNGVRINVIDETSRATGSRFGGVRAYWLPEGGTKIPSNVQFAQIELRLKKLAALGYATDELLQDAPALEAIMFFAFGEEIRFQVENAIIAGTGAGQPLGILNSPALVSVSKESGQAAATVEADNIMKMWSRRYIGPGNDYVWLINQEVEPLLQGMTISLGTAAMPVYLPVGGFANAPYGTLFGRPVIPVEYMSAPGTVGDIVLADLNEYALIDKGGIQQNTSIHVAFTTDETAFRAVYRVDGQPMWRSALTPFKGTNTTSPFVTLAARA